MKVSTGFVPLLDAAPLIIARELDFAAHEGLDLSLVKLPSWASVRDFLSIGQIETAHILSPLPLGMALGLAGLKADLSVLMVLSVNGNVFGVSNAIAARMHEAAWQPDLLDASSTGEALRRAVEQPLRIGVPFPISMHRELVEYWLSKFGVAFDIRSIPPSHMSEAVAAGEIDAFCVGEPWGSLAVDRGVAELCLAGKAIWAFAPEKVLVARSDWSDANPEAAKALIRAVWRAGQWLEQPDNHGVATEILASQTYLGISADITERALSGHLLTKARSFGHHMDDLISFHDGAANFPWRSQASWIGARLAERHGLDRDHTIATARSIWRSDIYRAALAHMPVKMPAASDKIEGSLDRKSEVPATSGSLILSANRFFDGHLFDPTG